MNASDVADTLELALLVSGCDHVNVRHRPRLQSDNGSSYIDCEPAEWLEDKGIYHVRGAPYHPQTQGKIVRLFSHYNYHRYHESLQNLTSADVYFGRGDQILQRREKGSNKTLSTNAACNTARRPLKINKQMNQILA